MTDTKELVERVRETLGWGSYDPNVGRWLPTYDMKRRDNALAALSELEAALESYEAEVTILRRERDYWAGEGVALQQRAEAAERERDSWAASHAERDKLLWKADARVAELEEALHAIADKGSYLIEGKWTFEPAAIARAALDRAKS